MSCWHRLYRNLSEVVVVVICEGIMVMICERHTFLICSCLSIYIFGSFLFCLYFYSLCLFIYFFLFFFWIWIIAVSPPISGRSPFWLPWLGPMTYLLPMTFKVLDFPILWLWEQYIWYIHVYVFDNPLWLGQSVSLNITSLKNLITIHSSIPWSYLRRK